MLEAAAYMDQMLLIQWFHGIVEVLSGLIYNDAPGIVS